ncbi:hypothetical protein B0H17DRAFT_1208323 [Mycena rosella]|uniref:CxC2-like cysteine cluster KDZ transposase-associated domain-containing protein n=1 Tax=Mycena rosella TaxID=1033263 RepID=A0AAD7G6W7_MYCRO|nr:hypothetical protein B0H17DRAFT_1208323 [Mycena rosella]
MHTDDLRHYEHILSHLNTRAYIRWELELIRLDNVRSHLYKQMQNASGYRAITTFRAKIAPVERRIALAVEKLPVLDNCRCLTLVEWMLEEMFLPPKRPIEREDGEDSEERRTRPRVSDGREVSIPSPTGGKGAESPVVEGEVAGGAAVRAEGLATEVSYSKRRQLQRQAQRAASYHNLPMSNTSDSTAQLFTDAEDKAFKRYAVTTAANGLPVKNVKLQQWLDWYLPGPARFRSQGYVAGSAVFARVRDRARARKERVDRLMRACQSLRGAAPRVLRIRSATQRTVEKPQKSVVDRERERDEHEARKERVQFLMNLRYGGKGGKGGKGKQLQKCEVQCQKSMPGYNLSLELTAMSPDTRDGIIAELRKMDSVDGAVACERCGGPGGEYRCSWCLWAVISCRLCLLKGHESAPLHPIEILGLGGWTATTLQEVGLRIQLGHGPSGACSEPVEDEEFMIYDMAGQHRVNIDYCGCNGAPSRGQQIQDAHLFPLPWGEHNMTSPRAAMTLDMARFYDERAGSLSADEGDDSSSESTAATVPMKSIAWGKTSTAQRPSSESPVASDHTSGSIRARHPAQKSVAQGKTSTSSTGPSSESPAAGDHPSGTIRARRPTKKSMSSHAAAKSASGSVTRTTPSIRT